MILVIDTETRFATAQLIPEFTCPFCQTAGKVEMSVYQTYLGIFYGVPLAPGRKLGAAYCHHCQQPLPAKSDKQGLKAAFKQVAAGVRPRLVSYSGSIILALLLAWGVGWVVSEIQTNKAQLRTEAQTVAWAADPQPGDVHVVSLDQEPTLTYSLFKVVSVSGDEVTLRAHREKKPYRHERSQAKGFSLADSEFSGASIVTGKAMLARQRIPTGKYTSLSIKEVIRPSQP